MVFILAIFLSAAIGLKNFKLDALGQGCIHGGRARGRNERWAVLDRLARLGSGLSPAQRNDWAWFKEQWDRNMLAEHGANWGGTFAGWIQQVLNDIEAGVADSFFLFVHTETQPCFSHEKSLAVPG